MREVAFGALCFLMDFITWMNPLFCAGLSDVPGEAMVKLYCPKCQDVYTPKSSRHHHTDGAYFGTGFPHMLFMVHPEYRPKRPTNQFVPRYLPKLLSRSSFESCLLCSVYTLVCSFSQPTKRSESRIKKSFNFFLSLFFRLYGFKIHPLAYQLQYQAASNFKAPTMRMNYNGGKR